MKIGRIFSLDNMSGSVGVIIAIIFTALLMYWLGKIIYKHIKKKSDENNKV